VRCNQCTLRSEKANTFCISHKKIKEIEQTSQTNVTHLHGSATVL